MTGLDCNILVQLALADHPANPATVAAVQAETREGRRLAVPSLVVTELLHVVTDPRRFAPPLTMIEAMDWIEEFLSNPAVTLLEPTWDSLRQALKWMRQFNLGRKRILDSHLAAVLHTAGVRRLLTSNPSDFAVLGALELVAPLAPLASEAQRYLGPIDAQEYELIRKVLEEERWVVRRAAVRLGMSHQTLLRRLEKWPDLRERGLAGVVPEARRSLSPIDAQEYELVRKALEEERWVVRRAAARLGMSHQALLRRLEKWPELRRGGSGAD